MPKDVPIGEGYTGEAMVARFPGQYRNPETEIRSEGDRAYYTPEFPGSASAPTAVTDPDQGRQMVTRDIPGIGIVSVPASDALAMMPQANTEPQVLQGPMLPPADTGAGQLYPAEHEMAGLEALGHKMMRSGEAGANLVAYASNVARCAVSQAKQGRIRSLSEVEDFIRKHVENLAQRMEKALNRRLTRLQKIKDYTIEQAIRQTKPVVARILGSPAPGRATPPKARGASDWTGTMFAGGMGDLKQAIANLYAGKELDKMRDAFFKLNDSIRQAFETMPALSTGYADATSRIAMQPVGAGIPVSPVTENAMKEKGAAAQGLKALTGFNYITETMRKAIEPNLAQIKDIFPAINSQLVQIGNFDRAFMTHVGKYPEFVNLWDRIQNRHNELFRIARPASGPVQDVNDEAYLATAQQAVEELTGVRVETPGQVGLGVIGTIGLIVTIVIAIASVIVAVKAVSFMKEYNFKGQALLQNQKEYEERMQARRREFMAKCGIEGKSATECEQEWNTVKASADQGQKAVQADLAAKVPAPPSIGAYLLPAAGIFGLVMVLPKIIGLG